MGLFGKKKPAEDSTPAVPETELNDAALSDDTDEGSELDDFGLADDDNEEETSDGYNGVKGEDIIAALHRTDAMKDTVIGGLGSISEVLGGVSMDAVAEKFTERSYGLRAKKIAFVGAGGGVGTSSMLLEVASRVAAKRKRVLIIDLNVVGGICELILHSPIKGKREDLLTLISRTSDLSNTIVQGRDGISTIGFRHRALDTIASVDSAIFGRPFNDLIAEVSAGFDFVFIDCGSDLNFYLANDALYRTDAGYIVTDGGLSSVQKLATLRTSFRYCGIVSSAFGVICNKNTRSITQAISDMDYRVAGEVPYLLSFKNANLQAKLLGNDFIYSETAGVQGAKATLDAIAEEIVTPVVPPIADGERAKDMQFDEEEKQKAGEEG